MINFKIYTSHKQLPKSWDDMVCQDIMLTTQYLKALERALPENISVSYIAIYKNEELVGAALVEHVRLYLKDMFRKSSDLAIKRFFKDMISRVLRGNILVIGNLTHTGQHGIAFIKEKINPIEFIESVLNAVNKIKDEIKKKSGKTIRIIMFKDYFLNDVIHKAKPVFKSKNFISVTVQPNMVLKINSSWIKIDDYINSLNKKYKIRYRRARKKFGDFEKREMDIDAVADCTQKLHTLYSNVSNNAKFNTFFLPDHHFYSLKEELKDDFKIFGYYSNNSLIGFYSLILNNDILETYFLGYDSEYQYRNQLYLNMLYDMLEFGIDNKFNSIVYARTAMEIKSSVGAHPLEMMMYMKHTNALLNRLLKGIFNFMKPNLKWEKRHPFKNEKPQKKHYPGL